MLDCLQGQCELPVLELTIFERAFERVAVAGDRLHSVFVFHVLVISATSFSLDSFVCCFGRCRVITYVALIRKYVPISGELLCLAC